MACDAGKPIAPASLRLQAAAHPRHGSGAVYCSVLQWEEKHKDGQQSPVTFSRIASCLERVSEKLEWNSAASSTNPALYCSMGKGTELRVCCRQQHALCCLLAFVLSWQHHDSHLAPADTEGRRRDPATPRPCAVLSAMRSAGSAGRHNPGRGKAGEGGDCLSDVWLGTTAQGANAVLPQHCYPLGNLLLMTQGQIFPSCIMWCKYKLRGRIEEREKELPVQGQVRLQLAPVHVYPTHAVQPLRPQFGYGKAPPRTLLSSLPQHSARIMTQCSQHIAYCVHSFYR